MGRVLDENITCDKCGLVEPTLYRFVHKDERQAIKQRRVAVQHVEARRVLIPEGTIPERLFALREGWAFRYKELPGNRRQILSFIVPGDCISLESLIFPKFPFPYSINTLTPVTLCTFAVGDIIRIVNASPSQRAALDDEALRFYQSMTRRVIDLGRRRAHGRIAQLILELEEQLARHHLEKNHTFEFPLRQEHIADATGLTSAHVNRVLSEIRKKNLIDMGPRQLRIIDHNALVDIAERD